MGRPKTDPEERVINARVEPPADLSPALRKLWQREFARFPPGFFTDADVRGMVHYLIAVEEFDRIQKVHARARGAAKNDSAKEVRAISKTLTVLQRALRMFPSGRVHRQTHANLAAQPTVPEVPGKAAWEVMMDRAAENMRRDRTN